MDRFIKIISKVPEESSGEILNAILHCWAQQTLEQAIDAEIEQHVDQVSGRSKVILGIGNGQLPPSKIYTRGDIEVKRTRSQARGQEMLYQGFTSKILPT